MCMIKRKVLHLALAGTLLLSPFFGSASAGASALGESVANHSEQYINYKITNYDSADFVSYIFNKEGEKLPTSLSGLSKEGKLILNKNDLIPGDIVFFGTSPSSLLAAGIYTGNNKLVVAYKPYNTIKELSLDSSTVKNYFLGAKRISDDSTSSLPSQDKIIERVIAVGKEYLGTPYEYGSSRSNTRTFDCSDFVRQAFLEGAGITLPSNSRSQADYVKNVGKTTRDLSKLKPGDILFFMSYKGWKESDYNGINVSNQTITHNAIYIGNGKIIHTYSKDSGGVRIDTISNTHWEWRFIFGGSALK
jgi:cell wall-associated NlpC family hydrolase